MELDELKILLKEQPVKMRVIKSSGDIALLMRSKTKSITGKLKRSLLIEITACIVFAAACAATGIFGVYPSMRIYFTIFAVLSILFLPFLITLYNKTSSLNNAALPVKSNLQKLVTLLKEFIKRYFQLTMALIPVSLALSLSLGYNDEQLHNPENPLLPYFNTGWKIVIVVFYLTIFSAGIYYVTKWYLKKLYGNYLQQLELLIEELEE